MLGKKEVIFVSLHYFLVQTCPTYFDFYSFDPVNADGKLSLYFLCRLYSMQGWDIDGTSKYVKCTVIQYESRSSSTIHFTPHSSPLSYSLRLFTF